MTKDKMYLKDGKFYRNDEIVPAEFGNKEQIKLMKDAQEVLDAMSSKDGLELDVEVETTYEANVLWKCVCGTQLHASEIMDCEDDNDAILGDEKCHKCKKEYEIFRNEDFAIAVKLKPL